ncbi:MAG TPA: hypothetical protein VIG42_00240 [Solirubrobacteraceae bacterium]
MGVAVAVAIASADAASARAEATWRLEQPAPPAGARFKVPLGTPDDMEFYAPNEGLLSIEGNAVVPTGLLFWNGRTWTQLSTVCGGSGEASRIAWAGPDEFWVITEPSEPRVGSGLGLCHFKDGVVVGSYSTPLQSPEPFRPMDAAACGGPEDCWFAGIGSEDPAGQHIGAYHLHWDGTNLTGSYQPQGRGVSGLAFFDGTFYESTLEGTQAGDATDPVTLATPEPFGPILIHKLVGSTFTDANFLPFPYPGVPSEGSELLSAKADATDLWFSGGGAASGPDAPRDGSVPSPPIAVRYNEPFFQQAPIDTSLFSSVDRFVDISPAPGTESAWVADQALDERGSATDKAKVALIGADGGVTVNTLPASGPGRGSAQLVAATGPEEAWMATSAGWLFHYTSGAVLPENNDPAFATTITLRTNESVEQFVADTPPPDDSELFAPPPVQVETKPAAEPVQLVIPALLENIKVSRRGLTVTIAFRLTRLADVQLVAKLHGKVVARTRDERLKPGRRRLTLTFQRKLWPNALNFKTKELTKPKPVPATGSEGSPTGGPTAIGTSVRRHG